MDKTDLITLDGSALSPTEVLRIARHGAKVALALAAVKKIAASRRVVEAHLNDGEAHYGINTGFGSLAKKRIDRADLQTLQKNLVRSHAAGAMEPLREETVRAMMVCLAASLARGLSGVRPIVVETLVRMLNAGVTAVVPSVGSVGASGDLAPLAAVALVAIGEGRGTYKGREMDGGAALKAAGIKPLTLEAKEGLALINGTHLMCGEAALLVCDSLTLLDASLAALAMSIDACRASHAFLDTRLYKARNHAWTADVAARLSGMLRGSTIRTSHVENDPRVQDPYSLRAGPTVLGAVLEQMDGVVGAVDAELGAVTDNPLVFAGKRKNGRDARPPGESEEAIVSGANFHGMPIAIPLDVLAIALCHLAGISERRSYLMTGAFEPESHLKPFLAARPGLQSGLMVAQYAAAACVNEMVGLSAPASVANIPTCAGMEDYNSFGPRGAAKARRSMELARRVVAVELMCGAAGLECHRPLRSGTGVEAAYGVVRRYVKRLSDDRPLTGDIEGLAGAIGDGAFGMVG